MDEHDGDRTALERKIPRYDSSETHAIVIATDPDTAYRALKEVTLGEMTIVRALFVLRSLPGILLRTGSLPRRRDQPLLEQMVASGFPILSDEPGREVIIGLIAQPWKLAGGENVVAHDLAEFAAFDRPGFIKAATNFALRPQGDGTRVVMETRVVATDQLSGRRFARYWVMIRPASRLVRRRWLAAARRRAERA